MFQEKSAREPREAFPSEENKRLWRNPQMHTVSFRRHSKYDSTPGAPLRGALSTEGIQLAREAAATWAEQAREAGAEEIEIYESPSSMPLVKGVGAEARQIFPARARMTASIYEKALFGDLAPAHRDEQGTLQSDRRHREDLLGDLMETATHVEAIPAYFKARSAVYGKDMERFWHDYTTGRLDPAVASALEACGASTTLDLAKQFTRFLSGVEDSDHAVGSNENKKRAAIAVTHGEVMESFLHAVDKFRQHQGGGGEDLYTGMIGYNEGFDAHLGADGELNIVRKDADPVKINLAEFKAFLDASKAEG